MIHVANQVFVAIQVNRIPINLSGGRLRRLVLTEACNQFLPTIDVEILDDSGVLSLRPEVHDGAVMSVAICWTPADLESSWREYIVFPREMKSERNGFIFTAVGFLNYPLYILGGGYASYEMPSSSVAHQVAVESGLVPDVDGSSDNQIWIRHGTSRAKFLQQVTSAAWGNNNSLYVTAVNRDGRLLFVDVTRRRDAAPKWKFQTSDFTGLKQDPPQNTILVPEREYVAKFYSDVFNVSGGYGITQNSFSFVTGTFKSENPRDYSPRTTHLMVNSAINGTRFHHGYLDVGNFHPRYNLAIAQNLRNKALYSTHIMLVAPLQRPASLLDRAQFIYVDKSNNSMGSVLDGLYLIERIVQTVSENSYLVAYGLVREGVNSPRPLPRLKR